MSNKVKEDKRFNYITPEKYDFSKYTSIPNLSKNKQFPTHFYFVYDLDKSTIGNYLNTWFLGECIAKKATKNNSEDLVVDRMFTVKKMDSDTSYRLYQREINPIMINILNIINDKERKTNSDGEKLYQMKGHICSIDDSSFGIWFNDRTISELHETRIKIMKWINERDVINGDAFIQLCIDLGADKDSVDYN